MNSRDLGAMRGGIASGNTTGSITTGGFSFDEDTDALTSIKGPGLDYASKAQAEAANASGRAYRDYLLHNREYCYDQAQLCQNALDDYLGVEHHNVREVNKSGQPVDDGPQPGI